MASPETLKSNPTVRGFFSSLRDAMRDLHHDQRSIALVLRWFWDTLAAGIILPDELIQQPTCNSRDSVVNLSCELQLLPGFTLRRNLIAGLNVETSTSLLLFSSEFCFPYIGDPSRFVPYMTALIQKLHKANQMSAKFASMPLKLDTAEEGIMKLTATDHIDSLIIIMEVTYIIDRNEISGHWLVANEEQSPEH